MKSPEVALVLDQNYGEQLKELAKRVAVWIIGTPSNAAVARELWNQQPKPPYMITTFKPPSDVDETCFEYLMDDIELHHGYYRQTPPFSKLEVIGLDRHLLWTVFWLNTGLALRRRRV